MPWLSHGFECSWEQTPEFEKHDCKGMAYLVEIKCKPFQCGADVVCPEGESPEEKSCFTFTPIAPGMLPPLLLLVKPHSSKRGRIAISLVLHCMTEIDDTVKNNFSKNL